MFTDLRQAFRVLLKAPGFTAAVVAVLALGIGANTAIFSVVYGVVLKPLPFADPSRLVALEAATRGRPDAVSYPDLKDWAAQSKTIDRMAGYAENESTLTGAGDAVALTVAAVGGDFFQILGVPPLRGRWLTPADDGKGIARTAVISERLCEERFHRDEGVIGRIATFDGQPVTIVGVMPRSFEFPFTSEPVQAWFPVHALGLTAQFADQRGASFLRAFGRLAPGATLAQANAELATIAARLAQQYPDSRQRSVTAAPLQRVLVKDYRLGLLVLLGAVGVVLFPGEDPIGKRITFDYNESPPREIVGVVGDVKNIALQEATTGQIYAPFPQTPWPFMAAIVRTSGDPAPALAALGRLLPKLDASLAAFDVKPLTRYVRRVTATPRFTAALIGGFAALALVLAAVGLYGVMAHTVVQRRREIGIRVALGARPSDVRGLVVGQAFRLGAVGVAIGLVGALAATRVLASLLFGVSAWDPVTFAAICAPVAAVVLIAAYLPARRATKVDPAAALRTE